MTTLIFSVILLLAVALLRQFALYRQRDKKNSEPFAGILYAVGEAVIAVRRNSIPSQATVIAMHGFMEDHRYFVDLYDDPALELILLTSADYHVPVDDARPQRPAWAQPVNYPLGSIEYDAAVLNQALEHMPTTATIRVHGHSRGGAVVLEAAAQRPGLYRDVEVILEAPVLPKIAFHQNTERNFNPLGIWLLPFVMPLLARLPLATYGERIYGDLGSARKQTLLSGLANSPRHYATLIKNSRSIKSWVANTGYDIYQNVHRGVVLVGEDERVLDRTSMIDSARHAEGRLTIVEVPGTTHFVTQDNTACVPPLIKS